MLRTTLCNIAVMLVTMIGCKASAAEPQWGALILPAAGALFLAMFLDD